MMTLAELHRINDQARLAALEEARTRDDQADERCPDSGQRARAWERLADAADALCAQIVRDASYSSGTPAAQAV